MRRGRLMRSLSRGASDRRRWILWSRAHPVTSKFCQIDPPCDGYLHLETAAKPLTSLGRL